MIVKDILVGRAVKQSLEDGIAIGELKALEEKKQIARNFISKGISLEIISEATGLSIEELAAL